MAKKSDGIGYGKLVCANCGSANVRIMEWVDPNRGTIDALEGAVPAWSHAEDIPATETFCLKCSENSGVTGLRAFTRDRRLAARRRKRELMRLHSKREDIEAPEGRRP